MPSGRFRLPRNFSLTFRLTPLAAWSRTCKSRHERLELQKGLARTGNSLPLVFLTGHGEIPDSVCAMRQGAEDFLTKRAPREALLDAVRRALRRDARERGERARVRGLRARFDALSEREREVLQHVLRGQLNKQIAADLGIHERTVKLHRTAITTKLGVPSVAELTRLAHEAGLFTGSPLTFPERAVVAQPTTRLGCSSITDEQR